MTDTFDIERVSWVLDDTSLNRLLAVLDEADEVSFDLETTGLNEYHPQAKIVLASFTVQVGHTTDADTWLLPLYHPESVWLGSWRLVYRRVAQSLVGKFLMAHNGKFDCRWTSKQVGVDLSSSLQWDSRLSAHALNENASTKLKVRAPVTFDMERWDDFDLSYDNAALEVPLIDLGLYAARDTYWTWRLCMNHRIRMFTEPEYIDAPPIDSDEIEDARLGRLMQWISMPTVKTLTAIEQRGFLLDLEWVKDRIAQEEEVKATERAFLVDELEHGLDPERASFAPTSHWFRDWTMAMVDQGHLKVAATTKRGNPQWNKSVLVRQARQGSEVAERLLRLRGAVKRLEYLNSWLGYLRDDGCIHAQYNVGSLITGRLSSQEPNMQQITKVLRQAFVPREGFVIADFDYSQLELRVGAFLSRSAPMIEALQRGDDLHKMLAARITGKPPEEVTDEERQGGKAGNFGFEFGQTAYGFKFYAEDVYGISFTEEECVAIYNAFFEQWDGMREWHLKTLKTAHETGQVVSPVGRVRRLPDLYSSHDGKVRHAENAALNAPVQGFASDLMQTAAAIIEGNLPGYESVPEARLLATVHDSIVAELPADRWEEVAKQVIDRMTSVVLDVLSSKFHVEFDVPLVAEAKVGTRWGLGDIGELS